jgi:hypothetical protein
MAHAYFTGLELMSGSEGRNRAGLPTSSDPKPHERKSLIDTRILEFPEHFPANTQMQGRILLIPRLSFQHPVTIPPPSGNIHLLELFLEVHDATLMVRSFGRGHSVNAVSIGGNSSSVG